MRRPMVIAGLVLTSLVLVAACAAPVVPGRPTAATAAAPTGVVLPPRPRDLPLDGIDPCTLLTPAQRKVLGLLSRSARAMETAPLFQGPTCSITGAGPRSVGVDMALALHNGIGVITGPDAVGTLTPISVGGFPAILAREPDHPEDCSVDVDVHGHQFIDIAFISEGTAPVPQDDLCRGAVAVATAVVTTLLDR